MGRPSEGWKLRLKREVWHVRFTAHGQQVERSTGCRRHERERASQVAVEIYQRELRAPRPRKVLRGRGTEPLQEAGAEWLASATELAESTRGLYATHIDAHLAEWFPSLAEVTPERATAYMRDRLRHVRPATVRKELATLRALLRWAGEDTGVVPSVPVRALGKRHKQGRRPGKELTPAEVKRVIRNLPNWSPRGWPIRARFVVLYETGLRASTVDRLEVPRNYRKGRTTLAVEEQDDKGRYARELPLTSAARRALDSAAPESGLVFGEHDYRWYWKAAVQSAKLPPERSDAVPADFRTSRITHWLEDSGNLPGTQYLAGHRQATTTNRYARPSMRAAKDVLGPKK